MHSELPLSPPRSQPVFHAPSPAWPWRLLVGRGLLFLALQALLALAFLAAGQSEPWTAAAAWWMLTVFVANVICVLVMQRLFRAEGRSFWRLFRPAREHLWGDLLVMLGLSFVLGPVAMLPNFGLATLLFGSPQAAVDLMLRPLPWWGVLLGGLAFPLTQVLAELPLYFGYVAPRLEAQGLRPAAAVTLASLGLAFQHVAVPFLFDARYFVWRALMFIPFALTAGIMLRWRPRLLPYAVVVHGLMDLTFAAMLLPLAY
jgi:hypothetical protein